MPKTRPSQYQPNSGRDWSTWVRVANGSRGEKAHLRVDKHNAVCRRHILGTLWESRKAANLKSLQCLKGALKDRFHSLGSVLYEAHFQAKEKGGRPVSARRVQLANQQAEQLASWVQQLEKRHDAEVVEAVLREHVSPKLKAEEAISIPTTERDRIEEALLMLQNQKLLQQDKAMLLEEVVHLAETVPPEKLSPEFREETIDRAKNLEMLEAKLESENHQATEPPASNSDGEPLHEQAKEAIETRASSTNADGGLLHEQVKDIFLEGENIETFVEEQSQHQEEIKRTFDDYQGAKKTFSELKDGYLQVEKALGMARHQHSAAQVEIKQCDRELNYISSLTDRFKSQSGQIATLSRSDFERIKNDQELFNSAANKLSSEIIKLKRKKSEPGLRERRQRISALTKERKQYIKVAKKLGQQTSPVALSKKNLRAIQINLGKLEQRAEELQLHRANLMEDKILPLEQVIEARTGILNKFMRLGYEQRTQIKRLEAEFGEEFKLGSQHIVDSEAANPEIKSKSETKLQWEALKNSTWNSENLKELKDEAIKELFTFVHENLIYMNPDEQKEIARPRSILLAEIEARLSGLIGLRKAFNKAEENVSDIDQRICSAQDKKSPEFQAKKDRKVKVVLEEDGSADRKTEKGRTKKTTAALATLYREALDQRKAIEARRQSGKVLLETYRRFYGEADMGLSTLNNELQKPPDAVYISLARKLAASKSSADHQQAEEIETFLNQRKADIASGKLTQEAIPQAWQPISESWPDIKTVSKYFLSFLGKEDPRHWAAENKSKTQATLQKFKQIEPSSLNETMRQQYTENLNEAKEAYKEACEIDRLVYDERFSRHFDSVSRINEKLKRMHMEKQSPRETQV